MRDEIKRLIPRRMMPIARTAYRRMRFRPTDDILSAAKYKALPALKCSISYNVLGGYCVPESSRDRPAAQAILDNHVWEPRTIEFITEHCGHADIVHAGTFFGDFLPALSKGAAPNAKVWAFEPSSENYRCARITMEINALDNVVLINAGLGSRQEQLFLRTKDEGGRPLGGHSQITRGVDLLFGEQVQIVRIDDAVPPDRNVTIVQLDVEGHEKEALLGGLETIRRCRPILVLEVLPGATLLESEWFAQNILSLGYRRVATVHDNTVFARR
jgi:FkbM family methyltransferase